MTKSTLGVLLHLVFCAAVVPAISLAQETADEPAMQVAAELGDTQTTLQSLGGLEATIRSTEGQIEELQQRIRAAPDDVTREAQLNQLRKLREDLAAKKIQFTKFATDIDIRPFYEEAEAKFDWQQEVGKLIEPIVAEIENATAESRLISELRQRIDELAEQKRLAEEAVTNLEALLAAEPSGNLRTRLEQERDLWSRRLTDTSNELTALDLQLDNRLEERKSLLDSTTSFVQNFFRNRGFNLVLGTIAFCLVFFGVRAVGSVYRRFRRGKRRMDFGRRLGALLLKLFSVVGGLLASLLVFNAVGDWFLLGLLLIFLIGVGWASINALPQHLEAVRLMLNIGPVKEGQRVVFEGTPWKVESLGFGARLVNPLLDGGVQILPVRYLVGMQSRPPGEHEAWFPCRQGDWVELADGRIGRVACQTPSVVQLVELGGSQVVYQTPDFLSQTPRNLTTNFRTLSTFGIDYKHQADCTTKIPEAMEKALNEELPKIVDGEDLLHVAVLFQSAGASSLDYEIQVDLAGRAAPQQKRVRYAIQRILVDACNKHGWEIPFAQVTVHRATE